MAVASAVRKQQKGDIFLLVCSFAFAAITVVLTDGCWKRSQSWIESILSSCRRESSHRKHRTTSLTWLIITGPYCTSIINRLEVQHSHVVFCSLMPLFSWSISFFFSGRCCGWFRFFELNVCFTQSFYSLACMTYVITQSINSLAPRWHSNYNKAFGESIALISMLQ
jgi:hypothetical protein